MNSITASMGKKGPTWSREFDSLIRAIGECKSKAEEDSLISKEVEVLKPRLKDPKMDKRWLKELLVRLIYVEMLGQDASWAHVKALQACSETNLITKKVQQMEACTPCFTSLSVIVEYTQVQHENGMASQPVTIACILQPAGCIPGFISVPGLQRRHYHSGGEYTKHRPEKRQLSCWYES